jgi:hypothetical protein
MNRSLRVVLGLAAAASLGLTTQAFADPTGVKAGVLTCNVDSGWGLVFGSSKDLHCDFTSDGGKTSDHYEGKINKYGVDIGYHNGGIMAWAVFAPSTPVAPGSLTGGYGGVTASATVGVGAGANVLVGGSNKSVALQPLSLEGNTGLNVAAGVASIDLTYVP